MASAEIVQENITYLDESSINDHNHSISGLFEPDVYWFICFEMSIERKNRLLNYGKRILRLLYRRYIRSLPIFNRQMVNPLCGSNDTVHYDIYRLFIELSIIESYYNPEDIYFEFEIRSYGDLIDDSTWYLDMRHDDHAQVYPKDLKDIITGRRHHVAYDSDTEDEDESHGEDEINT
jgi:hypothetical protein